MLTFLWSKLTLKRRSLRYKTKHAELASGADHTILDNLADAVLVIDQNSIIQYSNTYWGLLSAQHKTNLTTHFTALLHPDDHHKWQCAIDDIRQYQDSGRSYGIELLVRLLVPGENIKWCDIRLQSSNNFHLPFFTATIREVTPRVQKNEIGKANYRNLSGLVNRMPAILYRGRNNHSWSMEYISEGCVALTGYQPSQLINQPQLSFGDLIHPEDAEKVWGKVQVALQECRYFELHYRLLHTDGHYLNVIEKGQGIYSATGAVLSIEGVIMEAL